MMPLLLRFTRVLSLAFFAVLGTSILMYSAPGYFTDAGEMDATHAATARTELGRMQREQASVASLLRLEVRAWSHGDLGRSRQFGTPVAPLVKERAWRSVRLLVLGVSFGWLLALLVAVPLSLRSRGLFAVSSAVLTSLLLALPVGVLAVFCLLANVGGPVLVLAVIVAARDLKILERLLKSIWRAPYVLHAQTSGLSIPQILRVHILPVMKGELLALTVMSFTLALSAFVPVEVIFDVSGLGQLAWSAAMNRDLPVLVAITALVSLCVGVAGCFDRRGSRLESSSCV